MANNKSHDDNTEGILIKQDSVMSLYEPTPMSPTQSNGKSFLSPNLSPNHTVNGQMKRNVSYDNLENRTEARVMVLYTGGTIGMIRNDKNGETLFIKTMSGHATFF